MEPVRKALAVAPQSPWSRVNGCEGGLTVMFFAWSLVKGASPRIIIG